MFEIIITVCFTIIKYFIGFTIIVTLISKLIESFNKKMCTCKNKLDGKIVLITGGNSGIGLEIARDLARRGARVVIASRNEKKSAEAVADIIQTTGNTNIEHKQLDLGSFDSVKKFAADFNSTYDRLDILINNAGVAGLKHKITADNINIVMQINYFGPFLLTNLLLDKLITSKPSRIIIVSSLMHHFAKFDLNDLKGHKKLHFLTVYSNSKLCNILWAKGLAKRLPDDVTVNSLHPGAVATDIYQRLYPTVRDIVVTFIGKIFKNSVEGAQTAIHLAVSDKVANETGEYYSECEKGWNSKQSKDDVLVEKLWAKIVDITSYSDK